MTYKGFHQELLSQVERLTGEGKPGVRNNAAADLQIINKVAAAEGTQMNVALVMGCLYRGIAIKLLLPDILQHIDNRRDILKRQIDQDFLGVTAHLALIKIRNNWWKNGMVKVMVVQSDHMVHRCEIAKHQKGEGISFCKGNRITEGVLVS